MSSQTLCIKCGTKVAQDAETCPTCGDLLQPPRPVVKASVPKEEELSSDHSDVASEKPQKAAKATVSVPSAPTILLTPEPPRELSTPRFIAILSAVFVIGLTAAVGLVLKRNEVVVVPQTTERVVEVPIGKHIEVPAQVQAPSATAAATERPAPEPLQAPTPTIQPNPQEGLAEQSAQRDTPDGIDSQGVVDRSKQGFSYWATSGHWYKAVSVPGGINWSDANTSAQSEGGYLVTITSQGENAFVFALINSPTLWRDGGHLSGQAVKHGPWIGLVRNPQNWGIWDWTNGEKLTFSTWRAGTPDNSGSGEQEDRGHFQSLGTVASTWNDCEGRTLLPGYVIEIDK